MGNRAAVERSNVSASDNDCADPIHFASPFFTQRISLSIAFSTEKPGSGGHARNHLAGNESIPGATIQDGPRAIRKGGGCCDRLALSCSKMASIILAVRRISRYGIGTGASSRIER